MFRVSKSSTARTRACALSPIRSTTRRNALRDQRYGHGVLIRAIASYARPAPRRRGQGAAARGPALAGERDGHCQRRSRVNLFFSENLDIPITGIVQFLSTLADTLSVTTAGSALSITHVAGYSTSTSNELTLTSFPHHRARGRASSSPTPTPPPGTTPSPSRTPLGNETASPSPPAPTASPPSPTTPPSTRPAPSLRARRSLPTAKSGQPLLLREPGHPDHRNRPVPQHPRRHLVRHRRRLGAQHHPRDRLRLQPPPTN